MLTLVVLLLVTAIGAEYRIYLMPALLTLFGCAFWESPTATLTMLAFMLGFPVYVRLLGRDAGVLSTFLVVELYVLALLRRRLVGEIRLVLPAVAVLLAYASGSLGMPSSALLMRSLRLLLGLAAAFMLMHLTLMYVRTKKDIAALIVSLGLMLAAQAAIAVVQAAVTGSQWAVLAPFAPRDTGHTLSEQLFRGLGTVGDFELLAEWLAGFVPIALCIAHVGRRLRSRVEGFGLLIILLVGIVATGTRGGLVAAAVGIVVYLVLLGRRSIGQAVAFAVALPVVVGLALLLVALALPGLAARLTSRLADSLFLFSAGQSLGGEAWLKVLLIALNREHWLHLPSSITSLRLWPYGFLSLEAVGYEGPSTLHSLALTIWFQGGLVGTVAWAWFALAALRAHKLCRQGPVLRIQLWAAALVAAVVAMLASEIKVEFLRAEHTMAFFFLMLGLSIAASRVAAQSTTPQLCQEAADGGESAMGAQAQR